jgi:hypothetical protein
MEKIAVTNTHAYYNTATIKVAKDFIVQTLSVRNPNTF